MIPAYIHAHAFTAMRGERWVAIVRANDREFTSRTFTSEREAHAEALEMLDRVRSLWAPDFPKTTKRV